MKYMTGYSWTGGNGGNGLPQPPIPPPLPPGVILLAVCMIIMFCIGFFWLTSLYVK